MARLMGYKLRPLTYYQSARRNTPSSVGFSTVKSRYYTMDQSSALVSQSSPVRKLYPTPSGSTGRATTVPLLLCNL